MTNYMKPDEAKKLVAENIRRFNEERGLNDAAHSPDNIRRLFTDTHAAWASALNEVSGLHPLPEILARAATLLRDAKLIADNPHLKQLNCVRFGNGVYVHAVKDLSQYEVYCGADFHPNERLSFETRVPTCPGCIEALKG